MVLDGLLHEFVPRATPSGRGEAFTGVGVVAVEVDVRAGAGAESHALLDAFWIGIAQVWQL